MLARGEPWSDDEGGAASPLLAGTRLLRLGGQVLETVGRFRVEAAGMTGERRLRYRAERLRNVAAEVCRLHGFDIHVDGAVPRRPVLMVANHVGFADAPVLAALTPCTFIAKDELRRWPVIGGGANALGTLFVRRGDAMSGAAALRRAMRALHAGVSVLGFPEGTTSHGQDVLPFRRGLFGLAQLTDVPIVPVALFYPSNDMAWVGDSWFLPHYMKLAMRPRSLVRVRVGAPILPSMARCPEDLAHLVRSQVRSLLWRLRA